MQKDVQFGDLRYNVVSRKALECRSLVRASLLVALQPICRSNPDHLYWSVVWLVSVQRVVGLETQYSATNIAHAAL